MVGRIPIEGEEGWQRLKHIYTTYTYAVYPLCSNTIYTYIHMRRIVHTKYKVSMYKKA